LNKDDDIAINRQGEGQASYKEIWRSSFMWCNNTYRILSYFVRKAM